MTVVPPTETVLCSLCESSNVCIVYDNLIDWGCGLPGTFSIVECKACGLQYLNPRPTEASIATYYPADYDPFVEPFPVPRSPKAWLRSRARILASLPYRIRFGTPGPSLRPRGNCRVLDIGCGTGYLLEQFQRAGWSVTGVDLSPQAVKAAASRLGSTRIYVGDLHSLPLERSSFDVILMSHSLEHVPDPRDTLRRVHELLQPDGRLWLSLPDVCSWESRVFGIDWRGYDVPRHLTHFTRETLSEMLRLCGFHVLGIRPQLLPVTVSDSLDRWLERRWGIRLNRVARRMTYYSIYFPVLASYLLGNAGAIELVAEKA